MNFVSFLLEKMTENMSADEIIAFMDKLVEDGQVHTYKHQIERNLISGQSTELEGFWFTYEGKA